MTAESDVTRLRKDVDELERIVRGDNGDGLTTKHKVLETRVVAMSTRVDSIYRLLWGGIIALGLERLASWIM